MASVRAKKTYIFRTKSEKSVLYWAIREHLRMFIISAAKISVFAFMMLTVAFAALATGLIFGCFLLAMARNPLEKDALFANAMIGFVLVESFVFTALLVSIAVQFAL